MDLELCKFFGLHPWASWKCHLTLIHAILNNADEPAITLAAQRSQAVILQAVQILLSQMLPVEPLLKISRSQAPSQRLNQETMSYTCRALAMLAACSDLHEPKLAQPHLGSDLREIKNGGVVLMRFLGGLVPFADQLTALVTLMFSTKNINKHQQYAV